MNETISCLYLSMVGYSVLNLTVSQLHQEQPPLVLALQICQRSLAWKIFTSYICVVIFVLDPFLCMYDNKIATAFPPTSFAWICRFWCDNLLNLLPVLSGGVSLTPVHLVRRSLLSISIVADGVYWEEFNYLVRRYSMIIVP